MVEAEFVEAEIAEAEMVEAKPRKRKLLKRIEEAKIKLTEIEAALAVQERI